MLHFLIKFVNGFTSKIVPIVGTSVQDTNLNHYPLGLTNLDEVCHHFFKFQTIVVPWIPRTGLHPQSFVRCAAFRIG